MHYIDHIKKTFSLDYRSMGLYRCLMGFIVIADVLFRLPDVGAFYTDAGLLPRSTVVTNLTWNYSLHLINGATGFAIAMFVIHAIFGLMLVLGYQSRWAMIGAFIMTVSTHNRNWLLQNGGDDVLRVLLFISIFLPLNKNFSLDSVHNKDKEAYKDVHLSTWGLMFYLQAFVIYFINYLTKDDAMWRSAYTAIEYSLRLDEIVTPFGLWIRDYPTLQRILTIFVIKLEQLGPLLLLMSFVFGRFWWIARFIVIVLFVALHIGIIFMMHIGIFPWVCIVMWLIFLPTPFWDKTTNHYHKQLSVLAATLNQFWMWYAAINFKTINTHKLARGVYQLVGAFMITTLMVWNLTTLENLHFKSPFFESIANWLRIDQKWSMFAPRPRMANIWVEIPAVLSDGSKIELLTGDRDIYRSKSEQFMKIIPNEHWSSFFFSLADHIEYANDYGVYLCREWNEKKVTLVPNTTLKRFEFIVYKQENLPRGEKGVIERIQSWKHWCFDDEFKKESTEPYEPI